MSRHYTNLFIFHIPNEMTNADLHALFSDCGPIVSVKIIADKITHRSLGYGFVRFKYPEDAEKAIQKYNGFKVSS